MKKKKSTKMDLQNSNNKLLNWLMNNRDVSKETVVLHHVLGNKR